MSIESVPASLLSTGSFICQGHGFAHIAPQRKCSGKGKGTVMSIGDTIKHKAIHKRSQNNARHMRFSSLMIGSLPYLRHLETLEILRKEDRKRSFGCLVCGPTLIPALCILFVPVVDSAVPPRLAMEAALKR